MYVCVCLCVCVCMTIYIYIYQLIVLKVFFLNKETI